jgi:hypothetical protein
MYYILVGSLLYMHLIFDSELYEYNIYLSIYGRLFFADICVNYSVEYFVYFYFT